MAINFEKKVQKNIFFVFNTLGTLVENKGDILSKKVAFKEGIEVY
jgi:hypothetical protein